MTQTEYTGYEHFTGIKMSPLGRRVADILGQTWRGIYHMSLACFESTDWSRDRFIEVRVDGYLSTFDNDFLTVLVVLCHDAAIRLEISPCHRRHMTLRFHQRNRHGNSYDMHPTIEDQIESIRDRQKKGA